MVSDKTIFTDEQVIAGARALWESESHHLIEMAGYPTDFDSQGRAILSPLKRQARLVATAMLEAAPQPDTVEPVGEVVPMIHLNWEKNESHSVALVDKKLPPGTKLYKHPPAQPDTVAAEHIARLINVFDAELTNDLDYPTYERFRDLIAPLRKVHADQARALLDQEKSDE